MLRRHGAAISALRPELVCEREQHAAVYLTSDDLCFKLLSLPVLTLRALIRMCAVAM